MKTSGFQSLRGLDRDLAQSLLHQIQDFWTHTSTALEGNTLTLGETRFVLKEGLTGIRQTLERPSGGDGSCARH